MASSTAAARTSDQIAGDDDDNNKRRRVSPTIPDQVLSTHPPAAAAASSAAAAVTPRVDANAPNSRGNSQNDRSNKATTNIDYQEGFPQLLLETLQSDNGETVAEGFAALASKIKNVTSAHEMNEFFTLGGHATVSILMRKSWPDANIHQSIQSMGCCCIARMIQKSEQLGLLKEKQGNQANQICSSCLANCRLLGIMELIVKALKDYPASDELQKYGLAALLNLLLVPAKMGDNTSSSKAHQDAKLLAEELDGVPIVAQAMARFPTEEIIQTLGLSILRLLCRLGMQKAPVMKTKALVVVAHAVQNFPDNESMGKASLAFMNAVLGPPSAGSSSSSSSEREQD